MSWSASQYSKFEAERNRPVIDLLAHIATRPVRSAIDIGCGPGNSTELLQARFPDAVVAGMDSSVDMIAAARARMPTCDFAIADISDWHAAASFDVILANAALQWLPDHAALLPALMARLAPGGSLAVQMPDNLNEATHRIMREVAAAGPWAAKLADAAAARTQLHDASWYHRLLAAHGTSIDIWRTVYHHRLADGAAGIVEWLKGTGLRPFLDPLDGEERATFLHDYQAAVAKAYPPLADGAVLLPFPRLFFVAVR